MPILLPLNGLINHCFNFFYYIIPRPSTDKKEPDCYEIYIVQSSSAKMCKREFRQGDEVIQKINWNSGIPSIQRDSATGHFFVADELRVSNHLINLPDPVELNEHRTLVLSDLSIPFDPKSKLIKMTHLRNHMYMFQTPIHPTIQEICIVRSSPPDSRNPRLNQKYFSKGDVIVKKIYLRTPNPLDILRTSKEDEFMLLRTSGSDDFAGYRFKLE